MAEVPIGPDETADELRAELVAPGLDACSSTPCGPVWVSPSPQEGETTYAEKMSPSDHHLDWTAPAVELHRVVRLGEAWTTFRGRAPQDPLDPPGRPDDRPTSDPDRATGPRRARSDRGSAPGPACSSSSRCSPRARVASRPRTGAVALASSPASGSARIRRERARRRRGRVEAPLPAGTRGGTGGRRGAAAGPRRAAADRAGRRLRQPRPAGPARPGRRLDQRDRGFVDRARLRHDPHAAVVRLVDRPVRDARARPADPHGPAPGRLPARLPRDPAPRRGQRHRRRGAHPFSRAGQRRAPPGGRCAPRLARRRHPAVLPGLDHRPAQRRPRRVDRGRGARGDERASRRRSSATTATTRTRPRSGWRPRCAPSPATWCSTCAPGPGGKATLLAAAGASGDRHRRPAGPGRDWSASNATQLGLDNVDVLTADGTRPPFVPDSFDRVLVDAPCSGLGSLRRRADARWRIQPSALDSLGRAAAGPARARPRAWSGRAAPSSTRCAPCRMPRPSTSTAGSNRPTPSSSRCCLPVRRSDRTGGVRCCCRSGPTRRAVRPTACSCCGSPAPNPTVSP